MPCLMPEKRVVERAAFRIGLERDVRHPLDGEAAPAVGESATVRAGLANELRLADGHLVIHEQAVLDDVETPCRPSARRRRRSRWWKDRLPGCDRRRCSSARCRTCSLPSLSGVQKVVPAKLASQPRARSSSVGWPTDSWIGEPEIGRVEDEIVIAGERPTSPSSFRGPVPRSSRLRRQNHNRGCNRNRCRAGPPWSCTTRISP